MKLNSSGFFIVRLEGGLGNQLFQLAFAISKAEKLNLPFKLDLSSYNRQPKRVTQRSYALNFLNLENQIYSPSNYFLRQLHKLNLLKPYFLIFGKLFQEKSINFDQDALNNNSKIYYSGYWQSHLYFMDNPKLISKFFEFQSKPNKYIEEIRNNILSDLTVMIHIRRGDYVSKTNANSFHGLLNIEYYQKAINYMLEKNPSYKFIVFSDEIEYCKKLDIFSNLNIDFVENDQNRAEWQDLYLMSNCSNQIIANSTFSWWSACLSDLKYSNENRTIIAPKNWFNNIKYNQEDRCPSHWLLM